MILVNPGGPGGSGLSFLETSGARLQNITGTNYDLIAWDPRGIGEALPSANCSGLVPSATTKIRRNLPNIYGSNFTDSFWNQQFSEAKVVGEKCKAVIGGQEDAGPHMSTAVNVRDMISIVDAYSQTEDGKRIPGSSLLNYWGFSYGTYIGETFGSMFPDRVGRVVLDGVVDPVEYSDGVNYSGVTFMDAVISTFFVYCYLAGPSACHFYTGTSALDIYNRFEAIFTQLDATYAAAQNWANATTIEEALVGTKEILTNAAYQPIVTFPSIATLAVSLEAALAAGKLPQFIAAASSPSTPSNITAWDRAVRCPDNGDSSYNLNFNDLQPYIAELENKSVIAGESDADVRVWCTGWSIVADEVYQGETRYCLWRLEI
jgi:pimeloyl-ACP methyl ester carboxylesterase